MNELRIIEQLAARLMREERPRHVRRQFYWYAAVILNCPIDTWDGARGIDPVLDELLNRA